MILFYFLHDVRDQQCATSCLGVWFQKNNPGISRGLSVKNWVFRHFLGNACVIFFYFLHDDRGQRCATSGLGVRFQKIIQGLAGDHVSKIAVFDIFLETLINFFDFVHDDRGHHCATSGQGIQFNKNNPGISRGLSVKRFGGFNIFLEKLI